VTAVADRVRYPADKEPAGRWRALLVIGVGTLLAFSPWFSASAVGPLLAAEWHTSGLQLPLLTVAVQLGFAGAALLLAITAVPDVVHGPVLFFGGTLVAAVGNLGFAYLADDPVAALGYRAVTGAGIAAVYPVAMKLIAGWFRRERGLAIGTLIGALTVGSALPHLFRAIGTIGGLDWHAVVAIASLAALLGGALVLVQGRPGPLETAAGRFSPAVAASAYREPSVRLANLGYLGHMWELYAMWTWVPAFIAASFAAAGLADPGPAALAAFVVVGTGGLGCVVAGALADRLGRTTMTIVAMAASGTCAVAIGFAFGAPPLVLLALAIVWGITVVADSAQFSVAVSELAPAGTAGSALSVQVAAGFILTGVTIVGVGLLSPTDGAAWRLAFGALALGPLVGVIAMWRLRGRPEALKMAGGRR
jgi:MFS family permease